MPRVEPILQFIKWSLIVVLVLVLAWVGLASLHLLPRANAIEQRSQALLAMPPTQAVGKRDAFSSVWLLEFAIPEGERDRVVAAARGGTGRFATDGYRFDDLSGIANGDLCIPEDADCLAKVRARPNAARAAIAAHPVALANVTALAGFDHYRRQTVVAGSDPLPPLAVPAWLQTTAAALRFVDGDHAEGLRRACTAADTWARLATRADHFGVQAVAADQFLADARLVAAMLDELPVTVTIPDACQTAFELPPDPSAVVCDAAKAMYREQGTRLRGFLQGPASNPAAASPPNWQTRLLFNPDAAIALSSPLFASYCSKDAGITTAAARIEQANSPLDVGLGQAVFNSMGTNLVRITNPRRWRTPEAVVARLQAVLATASILRARIKRHPVALH